MLFLFSEAQLLLGENLKRKGIVFAVICILFDFQIMNYRSFYYVIVFPYQRLMITLIVIHGATINAVDSACVLLI